MSWRRYDELCVNFRVMKDSLLKGDSELELRALIIVDTYFNSMECYSKMISKVGILDD